MVTALAYFLLAHTQAGAASLRLTYAPEQHLRPAFSPSGQYIAYVERGKDGDRGCIITRSGERVGSGGAAGQVIVGSPSWSRDSTQVCWVTSTGVIWVLGVDGVATSASAPIHGPPRQIVWQPRGGHVLVRTDMAIYSLAISGRSVSRRLDVHLDARGLGPMSLSSDGTRLAYVSGGSVYLTTSATSPGHAIAGPDMHCRAYTHVWLAPRGDRAILLGLDQRGGTRTRAFLIDVAQSALTPLDSAGLDAHDATWSPLVSGWFALAAGDALLLYDGDGRLQRRISGDGCPATSPAFDPHAQCIVYSGAVGVALGRGSAPAPNLLVTPLGERSGA